MTISGLSVVANVFVLILHHKNVKIQKPMPRLVRLFSPFYISKVCNVWLIEFDLKKIYLEVV